MEERAIVKVGILEPIEGKDIPAIVGLMNRAYRASGDEAGWTSEADYIAGDRTTESLVRAELLEKPHGSFLKWTDPSSGEILGCVWLEPAEGTTWYLGSLAADLARQNAGLGRSILHAAEHWVQERGGARIRMTVVNVRAALIEWYIRRGYHLTGEIEPFPYGDERFGIPLRDDLAFVILAKDLMPDN